MRFEAFDRPTRQNRAALPLHVYARLQPLLRLIVAFAAPTLVLCLIPVALPGASCESLKSIPLPHATITIAENVGAGAFKTDKPGFGGRPLRFDDVPGFCRVAVSSKPTSDSDIKIEVWLPASGWNGKFQATGNGCWTGAINYASMGNVVKTGSATAGTNAGHDSEFGCNADAGFALGHPEKLKDFAERAFHEMTVDAKTVISAYYASAPKLSFLDECGGGAREGLTEMQRFPEDYDAIAASGLDGHTTHHTIGQLWVWQAAHKEGEASYIQPAKYPILHQAALEACDAQDGVKDGVISDPTHCKFDPGVLECKAGDAPTCLTKPQVEAARTIYSPPTNPRTKEKLFGPLLPGSELEWAAQAGPDAQGYGVGFFRYFVFKDPNWDYRKRPVNFDSDAAAADAPENLILNATNPDISKFLARGGKFLSIGGWRDTAIAPFSNTEYFDALRAKLGPKRIKESVRLYMVPDMGHCPGTFGPGAYAVDTFHLIQDWKEKGQAPSDLIFTHYVDGKEDRKMRVCQYPDIARYKGSGDIKDPANYSCKAR